MADSDASYLLGALIQQARYNGASSFTLGFDTHSGFCRLHHKIDDGTDGSFNVLELVPPPVSAFPSLWKAIMRYLEPEGEFPPLNGAICAIEGRRRLRFPFHADDLISFSIRMIPGYMGSKPVGPINIDVIPPQVRGT
jgi:hypothetical protein